MKKIFTCTVFLLVITHTYAQTLARKYYITNSQVFSVAQHGNTIYLAGSFTSVGPNTGHAALLDDTAGICDQTLPNINGTVNAIVADRLGGWYLGGSFTRVDDAKFTNLVHIKADKTVDASFNPAPNQAVTALCVYNNTLYVGGYFSNIAGQSQHALAAFNIATGSLTAWAPQPDGVISQITARNGLIYLLGAFANIGGQPRSRVAAVDAVTGVPNAFAVSQNSSSGISAVALLGDTMYFAGNFTMFNNVPRNELAAVDVNTGITTSWAPTADNLVTCVYGYNGKIFIGGAFDLVNGKTHNGLAALDAVTGDVSTWNASLIGTGAFGATVNAIQASGDTLYVAGYFSSMEGQPRGNLAAITIGTGQVTSWNPLTNYYTDALALYNGQLYAGGEFTSVNTVPRNYLAAFDATTGKVTPWAPQLDGQVQHLLTKGDSVIISGDFFTINGTNRRFLAGLDSATGSLLPWSPAPDGRISALSLYQNTIYVGGGFSNIAGGSRYAVAGIDGATGLATPFSTSLNQSLNTVVSGIKATGTKVYIWGSFTSVGDSSRRNAAAVDAVTGAATAWNPNPDYAVNTMYFTGGSIFAGGGFGNIGGAARGSIAELDTVYGQATAWNPGISGGPVNSIVAYNGIVYAGGSFGWAGGVARGNIAAFDQQTGTVTGWNPGTDYAPINAVVPFNNSIMFGGSFTHFNYYSAANFAVAGIDITLPLQLVSFTAAAVSGNIVKLDWATANEANTARFIVQCSIDGNNFGDIAQIAAGGKSYNTYTYNDNALKNRGQLYYRLKMVDKDGKFTFSKTLYISIITGNRDFVVYPNPAHGQLTVNVTSSSNQKALLLITGTDGKIVQKQYVQLYTGNNNVAFTIATAVKGLYMVTVKMTDGQKTSPFLAY